MSQAGKRILLLFVCVLLTPISVVSEEQDPLIYASPGFVIYDPADIPERTMFARMTIVGRNLKNPAVIRGVITHPYGDGPFDILIENEEFVTEVNASFSDSEIEFEILLTGMDIDADSLVRFIPVIGNDDTATNPLLRPGSLPRDEYPHRVHWLMSEAFDQSGNPIDAEYKASSMLNRTDHSTGFHIDFSGFPDEIESVSLVAVGGAPVFPGYSIDPIVNNTYRESRFIEGIDSYPHLPLTFDIRLVDGTTYTITHPGGPGLLQISPPSGVLDWELMR